jgi:hypothetical protein
VELAKWEGTLRGSRRMTAGAKPYTMKVVRTVFNGGHEETYGNATRLVPTQLGYSAENGGVSWPAPWVAKKPYTLNAPTAARAAAPPDVVPVGQSMPRPDPGMAASAVAFPAYCRHFFPVICRSAKRGMRPSDCFVWCFEIAATPVLPPFPWPFGTIHQTKDTFSMVKCPDARPIVYDI